MKEQLRKRLLDLIVKDAPAEQISEALWDLTFAGAANGEPRSIKDAGLTKGECQLLLFALGGTELFRPVFDYAVGETA